MEILLVLSAQFGTAVAEIAADLRSTFAVSPSQGPMEHSELEESPRQFVSIIVYVRSPEAALSSMGCVRSPLSRMPGQSSFHMPHASRIERIRLGQITHLETVLACGTSCHPYYTKRVRR